MIIKEFTETTKIYPFEFPQAETETNEQFKRRLASAGGISVLTDAHSDDIGKISCDFGLPRAALSNEKFSDFAGKLNAAFEKAIVISAKAISKNRVAAT